MSELILTNEMSLARRLFQVQPTGQAKQIKQKQKKEPMPIMSMSMKKRRREESPDVTEGLRTLRRQGKAKGSSTTSGSECSEIEDEEDDPDPGVSKFPEFPPELDFMGGTNDKSKRRTDRYDSSESSDSGVATLSPSTSDSTELISSPYSPCCDLSSDASSTISCEPSSPESSSPPPPTLQPVSPPPKTPCSILGHPIMTAVSAVLAAADGAKKQQTPLANFISFQVPNNQNQTLKSSNNRTATTPFTLNCDVNRATATANSNPNFNSTKSSTPTNQVSGSPKPQNQKQNNNSNNNGNGAIKNIFAAALNFHQQQEKQKQIQKTKDASPVSKISNNINYSNSNQNNNNNNSTTLNKNNVQGTDLKSMNKSLALHTEGQKNKVITLNASPGAGSKVPPSPTTTPTTTSDLQKSLNSLNSVSISSTSTKQGAVTSTSNSGVKKIRLEADSPVKTAAGALCKNLTSPPSGAKNGPKKTDSCPNVTAKKLSSSSVSSNKKVSSPQFSSTCTGRDSPKSRKRKLVEESDSEKVVVTSTSVSTVSVEASAVQGGRVCSVEESLKTTTVATRTGVKVEKRKTEVVQSGSFSGALKSQQHCCMWKGCKTETSVNLLEHIQTVHVSGQVKAEGFICLWEGCKVYNRKSSSLSWLERHVLSHSGNKPFKCIFPGCGQSFSAQGALERHVNSHISTNGTTISLPNRKLDSSPLKGSRRKKQRCRKQRLNIGQYVDYFDKRVMEVIKHRLATSVGFHTVNPHDCTFRGQVVAKRRAQGQETQVLVHWYPELIIPDEWMSVKEYKSEKVVPLTRIPKDKLALVYPTLVSSPRKEKASRKWQPNVVPSPPCSSSMSSSSSSSGLSSSTPSPASSISPISEFANSFFYVDDKSEDEGIAHCKSSKSSKKISSKLENSSSVSNNSARKNSSLSKRQEEDFSNEEDEEQDWAMEVLMDNLLLQTS